MWSDPISPARMRDLVDRLRSALPVSLAPLRDPVRLHSLATPEQVAELLHTEPGFAWLDGAHTRNMLLHRPVAVVSCDGETANVNGVSFPARGMELVEALLEVSRGGLLAGFLSYDLAAEIEDLDPWPAADFDFPTLHFVLYDSALVYEDQSWHVLGANRSAEELLERAARIKLPTAHGPISLGPLTSRPSQPCFEAAVGRIVRRIHNGDFFQTNLCRRLETPLDACQTWELYRRMRAISPARYGAFLSLVPERAVLSVSPELFLKVDADRNVESRPIKGTRPRGSTEAEDRALAAELLASEKDRAELAMIVDVVRNDLSRVCETGSVTVAWHAEMETLPTVHHTVSTVRGRLREGVSLAALLRAAFPAASITGAPKIEAIRAAAEEERQRRGPAMGAVGWILPGGFEGAGEMELSVAIRTAFVTGGRVLYYAGGGITAESHPAAEFDETRHKAAAFLRALGG